jgi:hypothetical protein
VLRQRRVVRRAGALRAATSLCDDRDKHVFWDPYHPSEAANVLLAKYIVDGDTKYISPINLRKLYSL